MPALPDASTQWEIDPATVAGLAEDIEAGRVALVDCREPDEWDICHLPGARLVPLSRFSEMSPALISQNVPSIVYCHHGMRSLRATQFLRAQGLAQSWSMTGGIDRWSNEVDPELPRY